MRSFINPHIWYHIPYIKYVIETPVLSCYKYM